MLGSAGVGVGDGASEAVVGRIEVVSVIVGALNLATLVVGFSVCGVT